MAGLSQPLRGLKRRRDDKGDENTTHRNNSLSKDNEAPDLGLKAGRRGKNDSEKRFECTHEECGKHYSRAEHLYRHQLNHSPKEFFHCDFPGCTRSFVRQDVYARHRDRHPEHEQLQDARSSSLLDSQSAHSDTESQSPGPLSSTIPRDAGSPAFLDSQRMNQNPTPLLPPNHNGNPSSNLNSSYFQGTDHVPPGATDIDIRGLQFQHGLLGNTTRQSTDYQDPELIYARYQKDGYAAGHDSMHTAEPGTHYGSAISDAQYQKSTAGAEYLQSESQQSPSTQRDLFNFMMSADAPSTVNHTSASSYTAIPAPINAYATGQDFPPATSSSLGVSMLSTSSGIGLQRNNSGLHVLSSADATSAGAVASAACDPLSEDNVNAAYSMSRLDEQGANASPSAATDDFAAWLFNEQANLRSSIFPMYIEPAIGTALYSGDQGGQLYPNYFADPALNNAYPDVTQRPLSLADYSMPSAFLNSTTLSQGKRRRLIELMELRFNEVEHSAVRYSKEVVLEGDHDSVDHVLSMRSMQLYIWSYWHHFHAQLPILHEPTFSADSNHDYLLLAVMAIGASCLDSTHGLAIADAAVQLSNFIAWHLRWLVFVDADFQPPAKLWIFQTLLLLEVYEKMKGTRTLHERAHVHFGTTLTLMRRGSFLIGNPRPESPPASIESYHSDPQPSQTAAEARSFMPEEWWNHWIAAEATRRAAFAAFVLDSTHATLFGHAAVMVVHEIRLPLPCDDALWSATSSAEVGRVKATLHANGVQPTTFLDGLKKTLSGRKVRTNPFGRVILMAGLLSISWHMRQRDLQGSSLGVRALGVPDGWKDSIIRAFDFWKKDLDESLIHMRSAALDWQRSGAGMIEDEKMSEASGTMLHHLSHMAMHTDIVDCQIFAGATRLLGRTVTHTDQTRVKKKMTLWVNSAQARDAVFHAIKFIKQVMVPDAFNREDDSNSSYDQISRHLYNARDDSLFDRPRVLYFAALVVWCYGFALDGPLRPFPSHLTIEPTSSDPAAHWNHNAAWKNELARGNFRDATAFLGGPMGTARSSEMLQQVSTGRNKVVGLLGLVEMSFEGSRWELLHEATARLRWAIGMLRG